MKKESEWEMEENGDKVEEWEGDERIKWNKWMERDKIYNIT